ncbi:MAG: Ni/Fe hydrogenase subunit alpha [Polyangiaceae bacterium]|nr:Ni/Fe hydrogenase subunit alpha [Polyangiaceae bacterium]
MRRVTIDPITRLEGHGKIDLFLDAEGDVAEAYFQVPELRGFESFCVGRLAEEMPVITNRICGVCPEAHHMASVKAFDVTPPPAALKIRELVYATFFVADHTTHFYALGGPDLIVGPDAPAAERNLLGVVRKAGLELGRQVIATRARCHQVIERLGGRGIHPAAGLPGGWSKAVTEAVRVEVEAAARANVAFALTTLELFRGLVLDDPTWRAELGSDLYHHRTYYMGTVDPAGRVNFYDGTIRVIDPDGRELLRFPARDYAQHVAERTEPWSYLKFPYLRAIGWRGFVDGVESGVYCATPLARLNVATGMATPLAQQHFERFFAFFGGRPVHHRLATHWARLVELLYAAERMLELATDPEITSPEVRVLPAGGARPGPAVGSVEAPRGTLLHRYEADARGVLTHVDLVVGTTHNHAPIAMSIKRAAERLIRGGRIEPGLLNRIEMAFRLYDPCLSCATHALPGQMPLEVRVRSAAGEVLHTVRRGVP